MRVALKTLFTMAGRVVSAIVLALALQGLTVSAARDVSREMGFVEGAGAQRRVFATEPA